MLQFRLIVITGVGVDISMAKNGKLAAIPGFGGTVLSNLWHTTVTIKRNYEFYFLNDVKLAHL